jgi:predicted nucleotidyltransferase
MTPGTVRIAEALTDASRLRHRLSAARFAVAFGSHTRGTSNPDSDLDLLFVGDNPLGEEQIGWLSAQVKDLHHRHGLALDEEVSYEVKLYATSAEVSKAIGFGGYHVDAMGALTVPPVVVEPAYLNSAAFKLRLLVNALTSPHIFLGSDASRYRDQRTRAERTVALVALSLLDDWDTLAVPDAVAALITDPDSGRSGEDFLGYTSADGPLLYGLLHAGFADLATDHVLRTLNGSTFQQDRTRRKALIAAAVSRPGLAPTGIGGLPRQAPR